MARRSSCPSAREFRKLVNMSAGELRRWRKDKRSECYSYPETRERIDDLARLKKKPASKWTEEDCKLATRAVSFVKRMRGGLKRDGCSPGYTVSLRNWGHRVRGCRLPRKSCKPSSAAAAGLGGRTRRLRTRPRKRRGIQREAVRLGALKSGSG